MTSDTAQSIFLCVMGAGILVWLLSLNKVLRLGRTTGNADSFGVDQASAPDMEAGDVVIRGEPASLSKALVRSLRQPNVGMFGLLFKVVEESPERLVLAKTGPLVCNQPAGLYFSEAEFNFVPVGDGMVRVSYLLGYTRLVRLLRKIGLAIIFGVGLPVILIAGTLLWLFVVQSQIPGVRWQVFQSFQIVHALWPPFLFLAIYGMGRRQSKNFVENLIGSIEKID